MGFCLWSVTFVCNNHLVVLQNTLLNTYIHVSHPLCYCSSSIERMIDGARVSFFVVLAPFLSPSATNITRKKRCPHYTVNHSRLSWRRTINIHHLNWLTQKWGRSRVHPLFDSTHFNLNAWLVVFGLLHGAEILLICPCWRRNRDCGSQNHVPVLGAEMGKKIK